MEESCSKCKSIIGGINSEGFCQKCVNDSMTPQQKQKRNSRRKEKKHRMLFVTTDILWQEFISALPVGMTATEKIENLILSFVMDQRNSGENNGKTN